MADSQQSDRMFDLPPVRTMTPPNSSACGSAPAAAKVASAMSNARGCTSVNVTCDAQPNWASACTPEPAPRSNAESTGVRQVIRSSDKLAAPTPTT